MLCTKAPAEELQIPDAQLPALQLRPPQNSVHESMIPATLDLLQLSRVGGDGCRATDTKDG